MSGNWLRGSPPGSRLKNTIRAHSSASRCLRACAVTVAAPSWAGGVSPSSVCSQEEWHWTATTGPLRGAGAGRAGGASWAACRCAVSRAAVAVAARSSWSAGSLT